MLAIASLVDVGDIPSKPDIPGGGTEGVVATWGAVAEYVRLLSGACLTGRSKLGWTGYGTQDKIFSYSPSIMFPLHWSFGILLRGATFVLRL